MDLTRTLKERLRAGEIAIGGWCMMPGGVGAELMGSCGFDYVGIDTQHGLLGQEHVVEMVQALSLSGTPTLVRVPSVDADAIMKSLDAGAVGVVVPMVDSARQAVDAVAACRYWPDGQRSYGPLRTAWGPEGYDRLKANRDVICVVMVETVVAVQQLDSILEVPGVDAVYVGPSDLAISAGLQPTLQVDDPRHEKLIMQVLEGCQKRGVVAGIHCADAETAVRWRARGFQMLTLCNDAEMLRGAALGMLATVAEYESRRFEAIRPK